MVRLIASYSYVLEGETDVIVSPAWNVRTLKQIDGGLPYDLSLPPVLDKFQLPNGGFVLDAALLSAIGLSSTGPALEHANSPDSAVIATMIVLRLIRDQAGPNNRAEVETMRRKALGFCAVQLGRPDSSVDRLIDTLGGDDIPWMAALRKIFHPSVSWSAFELWCQMMPLARPIDTIWCARHFLEALALAPWSFYDVTKDIPMVRVTSPAGRHVFVGQPPMDAGEFGHNMRHGFQSEAALVTHVAAQPVRLLTEVQFGGFRAMFAAAPDAVETATGAEPLAHSDDDLSRAYGHKEIFEFHGHTGGSHVFELWRDDGQQEPHTPAEYTEVKKTTHLKGPAGMTKKRKFWFQAAVAGCGHVMVALTGDGASEEVNQVERFSTAQLEPQDSKRVWGNLESMLRYVLDATEGDGAFTLRLRKMRGDTAPATLRVDPEFDPEFGESCATEAWLRALVRDQDGL